MAMRDVFVSHAHSDRPLMGEVLAVFKQRGIQYWIAPDDIVPGTSYADAIVSSIRDSRAVLVFLSDAANKSEWVRNELEQAITFKKPRLPVRLDDCELADSLRLFLGPVQQFDARCQPFSQHAAGIADAVEQLLKEADKSPCVGHILPPRKRSRPPLLVWSIGVLLFLMVGLAVGWYARPNRSGTATQVSERERAAVVERVVAARAGLVSLSRDADASTFSKGLLQPQITQCCINLPDDETVWGATDQNQFSSVLNGIMAIEREVQRLRKLQEKVGAVVAANAAADEKLSQVVGSAALPQSPRVAAALADTPRELEDRLAEAIKLPEAGKPEPNEADLDARLQRIADVDREIEDLRQAIASAIAEDKREQTAIDDLAGARRKGETARAEALTAKADVLAIQQYRVAEASFAAGELSAARQEYPSATKSFAEAEHLFKVAKRVAEDLRCVEKGDAVEVEVILEPRAGEATSGRLARAERLSDERFRQWATAAKLGADERQLAILCEKREVLDVKQSARGWTYRFLYPRPANPGVSRVGDTSGGH